MSTVLDVQFELDWIDIELTSIGLELFNETIKDERIMLMVVFYIKIN